MSHENALVVIESRSLSRPMRQSDCRGESPQSSTKAVGETREASDTEQAFREHLKRVVFESVFGESPFSHYFRDVAITVNDSSVRVYGRVPTFYLKSLLQTRLRYALPDHDIENRVSVISSTGLSSASDVEL